MFGIKFVFLVICCKWLTYVAVDGNCDCWNETLHLWLWFVDQKLFCFLVNWLIIWDLHRVLGTGVPSFVNQLFHIMYEINWVVFMNINIWVPFFCPDCLSPCSIDWLATLQARWWSRLVVCPSALSGRKRSWLDRFTNGCSSPCICFSPPIG